MKSWFLFFVTVFLTIVAYGQDRAKISRELVAMELDRSNAIVAHDSVVLDKMYATEFTGVTALGYTVTKRDLMALFRKDNPSVVFTNDNHEVAVISAGAAILTGRLTAREKDTGKMISQSLFLHVLVKRDGRWQILKGQGTALPANGN